jgi:hypothetical protein
VVEVVEVVEEENGEDLATRVAQLSKELLVAEEATSKVQIELDRVDAEKEDLAALLSKTKEDLKQVQEAKQEGRQVHLCACMCMLSFPLFLHQ